MNQRQGQRRNRDYLSHAGSLSPTDAVSQKCGEKSTIPCKSAGRRLHHNTEGANSRHERCDTRVIIARSLPNIASLIRRVPFLRLPTRGVGGGAAVPFSA